MASRRVIADSDDEDGDDRPLTPLREDAETPPEIEPLSPQLPDTQLPDTQKAISDTTDQSFFASVYDEQHSRAFEHSQLIEQIVRQSQKASGSNGKASRPTKSKAEKSDASSATDVTIPVVLSNLGNQPPLFNDGKISITTPRKSVPGEWDVPSSAEGANSPRTAKSSKGKREKSYGKQKRTPSKMFGSSAAAEMFMGNDTTHETHPINDGDEPSLQSETKRGEFSLHDSILPDMPAPTNFYIAQSNLTTMQKLEYQRINVSQNGYSGLPVSHPNPKSSGISTVAYSTPSRYASSGPPLPWERSPMADTQLADTHDAIDIPSSPDVIAADYHRNAPVADMGPPYIYIHTVPHEAEASIGGFTKEDSPSKKRMKRPRDLGDEDELVQDQLMGSNTVNDKQDNHKRQRPNEHRIGLPSLNEDDGDIELIIHQHEEEPPREIEREEPPREGICRIDEPDHEIPATAPPISIIAPDPIQLEAQPAPQPKKRGRKKKQPISEQIIQDELSIETQVTSHDPNTATKGFETPAEPEKSKKRRGRPRKSDPANSKAPVSPVAPELEPIVSSKTPGNGAEGEDPVLERIETTKKPKKKRQAQKQEGGNVVINEPATDENTDRDISPLKEVSSNTRTQSQKAKSAEAVPAKFVTESPASPNLTPQPEEKAHTTPKPIPTSMTSQPKVPYRVGLSKRTRIASLLKIIKR
ncbi:uncharacterized protein GGS22DRAFT_195811 [Annulohypoxylon maeteangense]|uniref:uncharacterized protein n=1 Tax=Annulohypoxylon maeteangense TaxID=1927788 RepID=UPI0020087F7B|nr:uncharacterized protein GGS22DRAFT_195811 [Annulohypoxylon maeteangense]KAI0882563.1 hypothetical protein GGS22DRAFT_195811 [Annulohypoxylon maeteangense]